MDNLVMKRLQTQSNKVILIPVKMKAVFFLVFISLAGIAKPQEKKGFSFSEMDMRFGTDFNMNFNLDDFQVGTGMGVTDQRYKWMAMLNFDFRPYHKKIQIKESNSFISQYFEQRYFLSLWLEKRFFELDLPKSDINFFAGIKNGWMFGNYRGIERSPESYFAFSPAVGICFVKKIAMFRIGLSYLDLHTVDIPKTRLVLSMTIFGEGKGGAVE